MTERGQVELILRIFAYIIFLYAAFLIIQMLLGRRTTVIQVLVVIVGGIIIELLQIERKLGKLEGKIDNL